jgi:serralysin
MAQENVHVCIERPIPEKSSAMEMAVEVPKRWDQGAVLSVRFIGGDALFRKKVQQYAEQWHDFVNVRFRFGDDKDAQIRVAFESDGTSWSAVGKDALNRDWFPSQGPTMNYGWFTLTTGEDEFSRVILHEFGHVLGCIHEHQNPSTNIPWNKDAVYRYYADRGWSKNVVDQNIFRKYDKSQTRYTDFDEKSIMLYAIPKALTTGGYEVGWNRVLSEPDKRFIGEIYPKAV